MTKGTSSMGKHNSHSHGLCIRCNARAFHLQKKRCGNCGYPAKKIRKYNWSMKAIRRKTTGTGRCRYLKKLPLKAKNGFREGSTPQERRKNRQDRK
ncbi:unnamed protein product [Amoebophrya sp. A25]|nr:unnamed protein product [Amoebophrya sp. A25]|eukprot:GSA25T00013283001.1